MRSKILIVEDEPIEAMNFKQYLNSCNIDVIGVVSTGEDAINMVAELKPDLVLIDIVLEGVMDGIEVAAKIYDEFDVPVVYLTAHTEENTVDRAKLTSHYGYLIKPVNKTVLKNTIKLALHKHRLESKLKENESKYRTIFENTGTVTLILDENWMIYDVNSQIERLSGYTREEITGKKWTEFIVPEDYDRIKKYSKLREHDPDSAPGQYETRVRDVNGDVKEVLVTIATIPDTEKRVVTLLDITEMKNAKRYLEESEKRLSEMIEFLPDPTMVMDREEKIIAWNHAMEELTGVKKEDILYKGNYEYALPFYKYRRPGLINLVLNPDKKIEKKYDFIEKHGNTIIAESPAILKGEEKIIWGKAVPLYDSEGNITGAIETLRDITRLKKTENDLKQSEHKYRRILENVLDAYFQVDTEGQIIMASPSAASMYRYDSPEEMKGISAFSLYTDRKKILNKLRKHDKVMNLEAHALRKDGTSFWASVNAQYVYDEEDNKEGTEAFVRDITDAKKAEMQLKVSLAEKELINNVIIKLIDARSINNIYSIVGEAVKELLPDSYVIISGLSPDMENLRFVEILGAENYLDKLEAILGVDPYKIEFPVEEIPAEMLKEDHSRMLIEYPDGIYNLTFGRISRQVCKIIEKQFNIGRVYSIRFSIGSNHCGGVSILLPEGKYIQHEKTIETILQQTSIAIQRNLVIKEIKNSLHEKELLLKEIHHRVKNNLQIISSLLNLQEDYVSENPDAVDVLRESQNRVLSMAMIHEMIYQSEDLSSINFSNYIKTMVSNLFNSYAIKNIIPIINVEPIYLNIETAMPLGLIISELISNSLKYAFTPDKPGEISVKLTYKDEEFELIISDNGIGIPGEIDFNTKSTLGLQLVQTLAKQLDTTIQLDKSHGTKYTLKFQELKYKNRI